MVIVEDRRTELSIMTNVYISYIKYIILCTCIKQQKSESYHKVTFSTEMPVFIWKHIKNIRPILSS